MRAGSSCSSCATRLVRAARTEDDLLLAVMSTTIALPSVKRPLRISTDRGSSTSFCRRRRSGRAPNFSSKPLSIRYSRAFLLHRERDLLLDEPVGDLLHHQVEDLARGASLSRLWNTTISSMRLMNSGLNARFTSLMHEAADVLEVHPALLGLEAERACPC